MSGTVPENRPYSSSKDGEKRKVIIPDKMEGYESTTKFLQQIYIDSHNSYLANKQNK